METNTNIQTLINMLEKMKQAYIQELHRNVELREINRQLRKELANAIKGDSK
jgi:regulator of replication initiation timing